MMRSLKDMRSMVDCFCLDLTMLLLPWHFDIIVLDVVIGPSADIDSSDYEGTKPEVSFGDKFLKLSIKLM